MKQKICLFLAISLSIIFPTISASAVDVAPTSENQIEISEDERGNISTGCNTIKNSLKSLQKSDSKVRVILGTTYQTILAKYITPLNLSLVKSNKPNTELNHIQTNFTSTREDFNSQFISYSKSLEDLIGIDCKAEPDNFYKQLVKVRNERTKTANDVKTINSIITNHISSVNNLLITFESENNGSK